MLNRVSEGNIDVMFGKLQEIFKLVMDGEKKKREAYFEAYARIFIVLAVSQQQQMNQLLSVNCVFVAALHRLCGPAFIAKVLQKMCQALLDNHKQMIAAADDEGE